MVLLWMNLGELDKLHTGLKSARCQLHVHRRPCHHCSERKIRNKGGKKDPPYNNITRNGVDSGKWVEIVRLSRL